MGLPRRLLGLAVAVGLLAAPACGFRERRVQAEFVVETADRARTASSVRIVMTQTLRALEITRTDIQTHLFPIPIAGSLDVAGRRAAPGVTMPGAAPAETPFLVFDGELLYLHSLSPEEGERPWARVDLGEVEDVEDPLIGFNVINPATWVELLGGALTGSIERVDEEKVDGERLVHYEANFDREKAFQDLLDDDEFERLTTLFELMGVQSIVIPGEVWLDERGLPRRLVYEVEQRVDRRNAFELTLSFDFFEWGRDASIERPAEDDIVEVDGVLQLLGELGADQLLESFGAQLLLPTPEPERNP